MDVQDGGRADCGRAERSATPRVNAWPSRLHSRWCVVAVPMEVENGQPMQIDLGYTTCARRSHWAARKPRTPQQCSLGPRRSCWSWRLHCRRREPIRQQPRGLRQRTCTILKKLLQHHTHCHPPVAAARWAWLGPTLLVRAYECSEHAEGAELTPGMRRKLSIELAGKTCNIGRNRRVDRALAHVRARFVVL